MPRMTKKPGKPTKETPPPAPTLHIRWLIRRDMPEVLAIEEEPFEFRWSEDDFVRCLRQRNCIGLVAERAEGGGSRDEGQHPAIVGYVIYELHKTRLNILNLAVAAAARRTGVGAAMLAKLASKLSVQRRSRLTMEVSARNLVGHLFLAACGFRAVNVLREFYSRDWRTDEDAYLFVYRHGGVEGAESRADGRKEAE